MAGKELIATCNIYTHGYGKQFKYANSFFSPLNFFIIFFKSNIYNSLKVQYDSAWTLFPRVLRRGSALRVPSRSPPRADYYQLRLVTGHLWCQASCTNPALYPWCGPAQTDTFTEKWLEFQNCLGKDCDVGHRLSSSTPVKSLIGKCM